MPRILRALVPERYVTRLCVGSYATTRPGVYWQLQQRELHEPSTVALTLLPVDGHDVPDDAEVTELPRLVRRP